MNELNNLTPLKENQNNNDEQEYNEEVRTDNSFLFVLEEKLRIPEKIIRAIPSFITNRHLMHIGFISALLAGLCFFLTSFSKYWFIGATIFLISLLFCDRYDGRLARFHKVISKRGYYADHMFDTLSLFAIFLGLGLSPAMHISIALMIVIFYYIVAINTFLMTYIRGSFNVTFFRFSPAEAILLLAVISFISAFLPHPIILWHTSFLPMANITLFDFVGIIAIVAFFYIAVSTTIKNFVYVERFEKRYPADTIWTYLRKNSPETNTYINKILDDLDRMTKEKK